MMTLEGKKVGPPSKGLKILLKKIKSRRRWPTSKPRRQYRVMSYGLQIHTISQMLERNGISADLVDLRSLVDRTLTLPENIALISEAVHTALTVERYPSEKEILQEQADMWTAYMRANHLTHYVAYKLEGKTISDQMGVPSPRFRLQDYINNQPFFGVNKNSKLLFLHRYGKDISRS